MGDETFELSRRKALAGLGTIGVASAGAGLGTSAYFNDTETFENNSVTAGQLNLVVDYYTSVDQGQFGASTDSGEVDGNGSTEYSYTISDAKPGDSGKLAFCPKVVDNPGYVWVGSTGLTDYENGQTEPEEEVDTTRGDPGEGNGELSQNIVITSLQYASSVSLSDTDDDGNDEVDCSTLRELNYSSSDGTYTLADLAADLSDGGFQLDGEAVEDGSTDAYPGSSDADDQQGPCLCIHWEIPTSVENEIQTDAVEFGFEFQAEQERHNEDPESPFTSSS